MDRPSCGVTACCLLLESANRLAGRYTERNIITHHAKG
nr:MAG TPA: hypothetical protein [Caudoviricetes sp.]